MVRNAGACEDCAGINVPNRNTTPTQITREHTSSTTRATTHQTKHTHCTNQDHRHQQGTRGATSTHYKSSQDTKLIIPNYALIHTDSQRIYLHIKNVININ